MRHDIEVVIDRLDGGPTVARPTGRSGRAGAEAGQGKLDRRDADEQTPASRAIRRPRTKKPKTSDEAATDDERRRRSRRATGTQPGDIAALVPLRLHALRPQLRAAEPAAVQLQQPAGHVPRVRRPGRVLQLRSRTCWCPTPDKSFEQGCFELIGPWNDLGRWKRHIYQGVADTIERKLGLAEGHAARNAVERARRRSCSDIWLCGTGDEHITFTWRAGKAAQKYGGTFEGIIPELLDKYRN